MSPCCHGNLCFGRVTENTIFTLNFDEFLHIMNKYVLNSVVKISVMFAKYFEYLVHHYTEVGRFLWTRCR